MPTDRRTLLKGLTAAGLAISGVGLAQASNASATAAPARSASSTEPTSAGPAVLAVTSSLDSSALDSAFIAGVQSSSPIASHSSLQGLDSAAFNQLARLLADSQKTLLVGLLDDASATLVLDLVRSAGGQVLSVEHHRVASNAAPWAQQLGQSLAAGRPLSPSSAVAGNESRVSLSCLI